MINLLCNPRFSTLLIALIVVSGLAGITSLPRNENPHTANRYAFVTTEFSGASARRIEALVTEPLEGQLREMPEIKHINSRSSAGFSSLAIELVDSVAMDETASVWSQVRDKLERSRTLLPQGAQSPVLEERTGYPYTNIVALTWSHQDSPPNMSVLRRYALELESKLRQLTGIDYIAIHGAPEEEIIVNIDSARVGLLGLSTDQIAQTIFQSDSKISAGEIHNQRMRLSVEVEGALETLERIRRIPLRQSIDGSTVVVGDIAQVKRQAKTPAKDLAIIDNKPAVVVGIRMLPSQRNDIWSKKLHQALRETQQQLPGNVRIKSIFNQEKHTSQRFQSLTRSILIGFFLIIFVLFITLGLRSALLVAATLPLTILFVFACMYITGLPIHQTSVKGLIIALGIMIDNAIVMVNTISRYKQQGVSAFEATAQALKQLWLPLLGSTLTTMLTFLPMMLMTGGAAEFAGPIGLTVVFSLLGSYLISHLVLSSAAGKFIQRQRSERWWQQGLQLKGMSAAFKKSINWSLNHPKTTLALVFLFPLIGFIAGSKLPEELFSPADRDMINLEVYLPASSSIERTKRITEKISSHIQGESSVKSLHWFIGRSAPSFYYNLVQGKDNLQYYAQAMLTLNHFSEVKYIVPKLQRQLDNLYPEAQIIIRRLQQGPPFDAPVEVRIIGPNLNTLQALGEQFSLRMMAVEEVTHVRTNLSDSVPKIWMSVDENLARAGQLNLTGIAGQLRDNVDGAIAGSVLEGTQSLPIRVQANGHKQVDPGAMHNWQFVSGESSTHKSQIPYTALGNLAIRPEIGLIARRDGERINMVSAYIRDQVLPSTVLERFKASLKHQAIDLPPGYRIEFAGEDEQRDQAMGALLGTVGIILILLVIVIVMSFNSFRMSAIVFFVAIQAAGLGMIALALSGKPFGFTATLGLMALIGLAINAAIVILAELKSSPAAIADDSSSIVSCVTHCSRHISSTTMTTAVGFLPLIISSGTFWPPFAYVIAGGTALTTLLSFYFVPVMFSLMTQRRAFQGSLLTQLNSSDQVPKSSDLPKV